MKNPFKRLSYNSPVILTYVLICTGALIANGLCGGWLNNTLLISYGHPSLLDPLTYPRLFLHVFGHSGVSHLANNMIMMLLLGPVVEEKYGSGNLIIMIATTALVTGVLNGLLFSTGIIGASGIVFMLIILSAFTNMKKGEIPITLILVVVIYLGQEVYSALFVADNVSQFAHLAGGISGLIFGWIYHKKLFNS